MRRLGFITIGVTAAVIGLQSTGALQFLEWETLNQWFRWRSPEDRSVPVVLVTITEADIQRSGRWPLSDQQVAALVRRVHRDRPTAIGLDLYRDLPVEPGNAELLGVFKTTPNLIGIKKVAGNTRGPAVLPPPILGDRNQVGANDLIIDGDNITRRNLLSVQENGRDVMALGTKLALLYLSQQGVTPTGGHQGACVHLGKAHFCRLQNNVGGYVGIDTDGFQTLSNFLRTTSGIPSFSLTEVMTDQVPASLMRDKVVLIGAKAESLWGDRFYTPYTTDGSSAWAGVEIHANVAAQIISSALDGRPLLQGVPALWGWVWILLWAGIGTALGWSLLSRLWTVILIPLSIGSIFGIAYVCFLTGWWIITISPMLALIGTAWLSRNYWVWRMLKLANHTLELKVQERTRELIEKNVALEQARLTAETAKQALEYLARTDELTQVANRRYFNEYLNQEWYQMLREQLPLSLILIDIDCFKLYNDTYGHPAGDMCLSRVSDVLQLVAKRQTDLVARYGGEEFAIILPNTPIAGAVHVADEIQTKIRQCQIPHRRSKVSEYVTLSMGVVCIVPAPQIAIEQLVNKADEALYQAKMAGRDQFVAVAFGE